MSWKTATMVKVLGGNKFLVRLIGKSKEFEVHGSHLRVRHSWQDGKWFIVGKIREGLHYNPYFPGGAIAMPKMLNDGAVEYEDDTPATESQMGKDVVTFLSWAAESEMEDRKLMGFKWIFVLSLALLQADYYRRSRWSVLESRKLVLDVVN